MFVKIEQYLIKFVENNNILYIITYIYLDLSTKITYFLGIIYTRYAVLYKHKLQYNEGFHMYEDFVRERITQLRLKRGVSEYQMSYDLGHSRGYVYNISSGKSLPPMSEFFAICEYFGLTPSEFFDSKTNNPDLVKKVIEGIDTLSDADMLLVLSLIDRLKKQ